MNISSRKTDNFLNWQQRVVAFVKKGFNSSQNPDNVCTDLWFCYPKFCTDTKNKLLLQLLPTSFLLHTGLYKIVNWTTYLCFHVNNLLILKFGNRSETTALAVSPLNSSELKGRKCACINLWLVGLSLTHLWESYRSWRIEFQFYWTSVHLLFFMICSN